MLYQRIVPDFTHNDDRGSLVQLVREGYNQVNYIFSEADCVRGNHYHKINKESFFIISGELELLLEDMATGEREKVKFSAGDMFCVMPMVKHTFSYKKPTQLISMYDQGVELENGKMDMYN